jgi:hypothetical protein
MPKATETTLEWHRSNRWHPPMAARLSPPVRRLFPVIPASHLPVIDGRIGPSGYGMTVQEVTAGGTVVTDHGDRVTSAFRPVVRAQGPWNLWSPIRDGDYVLPDHVGADEKHTEGIAWCSDCGAIARTSREIAHRRFPDVVRRKACRTYGPGYASVIGARIPSVTDGPDVLTRSVKVRPDYHGNTVCDGPSFTGTGQTVRVDMTPDMTARSVKGRTRTSRRRPDGGRITVGQLSAWLPNQPVMWLTTKTDPTVTGHRATVHALTDMADMMHRAADATGSRLWTTGPNRSWNRVPPRRPGAPFPTMFPGGPADTARDHDARAALHYGRAAELSGNVPDMTDDVNVPAVVGVLKSDGEPFKIRTARPRRSRAQIMADTAAARTGATG